MKQNINVFGLWETFILKHKKELGLRCEIEY